MRETFDASGALASVDVLAALCAVGRGAVSGTLRVEGPAAESVRFGFDAGALVGLESPPEISPAEVLIRAGKVQRATYEALTVGDFEDRFAVAAASGVVSRRETNWGLKISAIESLARVLSWRDGTYAFEEGPAEPTAPPLRLAVDQWILELFLRSNDRAFVVRAIGPTDIPVARSAEFAEGFTALGLTADADAVVEGIDGRRTIDQVVRRSRAEEFATLKLLAALIVLRLIRPIHELPAEGEPAEAAAAPAAENAVEEEWELAEAAPSAEIASEEGEPSGRTDEAPAEEPVPAAPPEPAETFAERELAPEPEPESETESVPVPLDAAEPETGGETDGAASGISMEPLPEIHVPLFALTAPETEAHGSEPDTEGDEPLVLGSAPERRLGAVRAAAVVVALAAIAGAILLRRRAPSPASPTPAPAAVSRPPDRTPPSAVAPPASPPPAASSVPERTPAPAPTASRRREPEKPAARSASPRPAAAASAAGAGWEKLARAGRTAFEHPGPHRYAIQLELACEEATLRKAFDSDPGRRSIWIAPYEFRGRSCYRVLWGKYRDLAAAKKAKSSLPAIFSEGANRPAVVPLGRGK